MSNKYSDADYKMSKKIAQLTKVIFHLHSRNEESEELIKAVRKGYEREIESIVRDANSIISKQKEAIRTQKENIGVKNKLNELQAKQESDKKKALEELNNYKIQISEKENRVCQEKEQTLRQIKSEVMSLKEKYEEKLHSLSELSKGNTNLKQTIEEMKRKHQIEIENHVKESNKKYNDLLHEKLFSEDRLKTTAEKEKNDLIVKYETQIKELLKKAVGDEKERLESILKQQVISFI